MAAYYNEIEPFAAEWLRQLIKAGIIAPGEVDERSIEDVAPDDLIGFTQCHFFAGIGVWSYALRQAGWPDDRPVWTGSCPCQSFSAAGKGLGKADPRHLWPTFYRLIEKCCPVTVFGEQVEAAIRHGWLDDVQADLEGSGYACGAVVFPACGIGAPHIRSRLYWLADSSGERLERGEEQPNGQKCASIERGGGDVGWLGNAESDGRNARWPEPSGPECIAATSSAIRMADANSAGLQQRSETAADAGQGYPIGADGGFDQPGYPCPTNGFWRDADWLLCRDGKWRPVEPGTFPLVNGAAQRVGRLRGYGNAINAEAAKAFIEAFMEITK